MTDSILASLSDRTAPSSGLDESAIPATASQDWPRPGWPDGFLREDHDYAISWVRSDGAGRVFFANFGKGSEVFSDPRILDHFLAGIQLVLGDIEVDTTPSTGNTTAAK